MVQTDFGCVQQVWQKTLQVQLKASEKMKRLWQHQGVVQSHGDF